MKKISIVQIKTNQKGNFNDIQNLKVELFDERNEVLLRQNYKSKIGDIYNILNIKWLPHGTYILKIQCEGLVKFEKIKIKDI